MKKLTAILLGMLITSSAALAQTNQVLSRNAVGYIKINIEKGKYAMLQNPFINLNTGNGSYTVTNLIGDQLPTGSSLFIWNEASQSYLSENKFPVIGWQPGTNILDPGNGFFVTVPSSAVSNSYDVYFMGEVPDSFTQPTKNVPIVNGYSMVGYPYPVQRLFTNTTLAAALPTGSSAFIWNQASQSYNSENKFPVIGWQPGTNMLSPGQAVFVSSAITTNWTEVKPYTWP